MRAITFFLLIALTSRAPGQAATGADPPTPTIAVEFVWTEVQWGQTDLFMLITNPNDFDIYVAGSGSSTTTLVAGELATSAFGCGPPCCSDPLAYTLLPAKSKLLLQWWRGCSLRPGPNRFHVSTSGERGPQLPWNYVAVGARQFDFVIVNPDTLSR